MPSISEFYGIKIYIYWKDQDRHKLPHFNAFYGEFEGVFTLRGDLIDGSIPPTAKKLIKKWATHNLLKINFTWNKISKGEPFEKLEGLK